MIKNKPEISFSTEKDTFSGYRDFVMFMTFYNTGTRVSEITRLRVNDVCLEGKASIIIHGKGRKRCVMAGINSNVNVRITIFAYQTHGGGNLPVRTAWPGGKVSATVVRPKGANLISPKAIISNGTG
jgi:hypothetical protein